MNETRFRQDAVFDNARSREAAFWKRDFSIICERLLKKEREEASKKEKGNEQVGVIVYIKKKKKQEMQLKIWNKF